MTTDNDKELHDILAFLAGTGFHLDPNEASREIARKNLNKPSSQYFRYPKLKKFSLLPKSILKKFNNKLEPPRAI